MDTQFTPSESLQLIERMIAQSKQSFNRYSFYFLLWGILLVAAMVVNYVLVAQGNDLGPMAWPVVGVLGGVISGIHGARERKQLHQANAMDRLIKWLWVGFLATLFTTMVGSVSSVGFVSVGSIMLLTGLPTFVTGQLMRFRPLILGGILFWILGTAAFFVDTQAMVLLYITSMVFGYLLPGYLLRRQEDALPTA